MALIRFFAQEHIVYAERLLEPASNHDDFLFVLAETKVGAELHIHLGRYVLMIWKSRMVLRAAPTTTTAQPLPSSSPPVSGAMCDIDMEGL